MSAPSPKPIETPTREVVVALAIVTMLVLLSRMEQKRAASPSEPELPRSPTKPPLFSISTFTGWALRFADSINPRPRPEIDNIELKAFQRFALELDNFNQLNSKISGLCSPHSTAQRSGRAAQYPDIPYHLAFIKGWGEFLEERGFILRFEPHEITDTAQGSVVMNARFSLEIDDLQRAAVALEKLLPACYVERVPTELANLLRHIEASCESFASRRPEKDTFWGRRRLIKDIQMLRSGLHNLGRHGSATELQFLEDLLTQSPPLFSNYALLLQLTRNQNAIDPHFWVDPQNLSTAFHVADLSITHASRRHPVVNLTTQRMLRTLRDCLDFLSLELENQLDVSDYEDRGGGAALAEKEIEPPHKNYPPHVLAQFYAALRDLNRNDDIFARRTPGPLIGKRIRIQERPEDAK